MHFYYQTELFQWVFCETILTALYPLSPIPQNAIEWLTKVDVNVHNPDHHNVPRFLNRILGIPSDWQRKLFQLFSSTLDGLIRSAKLEKSYDQGE